VTQKELPEYSIVCEILSVGYFLTVSTFTDVFICSGMESFESESVNSFLRFLASKQDNFGG
jgi:hypothetical protein